MFVSLRTNSPRALTAMILGFLVGVPAIAAGDPNVCDQPGEVPDVLVSQIHQAARWGGEGGITAYSIGTIACNIGTCWLNWNDTTPDHPVIGQNMFRLSAGRFEHVGQSWLKHGFSATSLDHCFNDCVPSDGEHLGVHCSDPYAFTLNGHQAGLGPKFEVNASTGVFPYPPSNAGLVTSVIERRLQVADADLDPANHPGALYFVEGQYVTADDGAPDNNASYRPIRVVVSAPGVFDTQPEGTTVVGLPAVHAWSDVDPLVRVGTASSPGDGSFHVGARARRLPSGAWRYEYAVQNANSHRSAGSFAVDLPLGLAPADVSFHDVDYHSGEPFDGSDWTHNAGTGARLEWATQSFAVDPEANALRWGTLYNFGFEVDAAPTPVVATLGLFRPPAVSEPSDLGLATLGPRPCNDDGTCDPRENCANCPEDCSAAGADTDGDAVGDCDCNDGDGQVWGTPGEVAALLATGPGELEWQPVARPGAQVPSYEVLRSPDPANFVGPAVCLGDADATDTAVSIPGLPIAGDVFFYLVRAVNGCDAGQGSLGPDAGGWPRAGRECTPRS